MARYIARPPVALDRLSQRPDGLITYKLKNRYRDGTDRLLFSPMEFLEKLAASVPRPRVHGTRYHGLFAPHAKARSTIVQRTQKKKEKKGDLPDNETKKQARMSWAKLMNRVFNIDVSHCRFCKGEIKIISAILERSVIEKILSHLGLPTDPPPILSARAPPQATFDDYCQNKPSDSWNV